MRLLIGMLFLVLVGCDVEERNREAEKARLTEAENIAAIRNMSVGNRWIAPVLRWEKCEENERWTKYRAFNYYRGFPDYYYVTVSRDTIIAIWTGQH